MSKKKTEMYKSLAIATAQRMKNAAKAPKIGAVDKAKTKQELAEANPLLASLMGKKKAK